VSYADRQWKKGKLARPTDWAPNGCGSVGTSLLVPDELAGVDLGGCCDVHDLAYHRGGFFGLISRKPVADFGLAMCLWQRFGAAAQARFERGSMSGDLKGIGTVLLAAAVCPLYFTAVTAVGWLPFIWRWRYLPTKDYALRQMGRKLKIRGLL
jgi:hypothetical protein